MRDQAVTRVKDGGRVVLPAGFRRELGLAIGSNVVLRLSGKNIVVSSAAEAMRHAQAQVLKKIKQPKKSMAKELIAERRREAVNE